MAKVSLGTGKIISRATIGNGRATHLTRNDNKPVDYGLPEILVYTLPRTGSNAVHSICRDQLQAEAYHMHTLDVEPTASFALPLRIAEGREKFYVLTMVREPIGRNISEWNALEGRKGNFLEDFDHDKMLTWFDEEIKKYFGVDVFEYPFEVKTGFQIINHCNLGLSIMRTDRLDDVITSGGIKGLVPGTSKKDIKPFSKEVREYKLPPLTEEYIDTMLNTKYAKHFWSEEELEALANKYKASCVAS
jgi:hypothetical protein